MDNANNSVGATTSNQIINVDQDFNGDLDKAVQVANNGDTVELGRRTYTTDGLSLNKDITIDGVRGETVITGKDATRESIITVNAGASGSTIQDLEITDGNNGVNVLSASDVTLQNLAIHNIGNDKPIRDGQNNIAVALTSADGFKVLDSQIYDIGRSGIDITDTDGGVVRGVTLEDINLAAEHSQSFDAAGIKLFNTNAVEILDNKLDNINAFNIWNDITSNTTIDGNDITGVGDNFLAPEFNSFVRVAGIYNEKSYKSVVDNNKVEANGFIAFDATEFTTETMVLGDNNQFSSIELNSTDFWANEELEKRVAITEDPDAANFTLFEDEFYTGGTFGG